MQRSMSMWTSPHITMKYHVDVLVTKKKRKEKQYIVLFYSSQGKRPVQIRRIFLSLLLKPYSLSGLLRCGKSCRLRWMNYLRPDIKRGNIGQDEEDLIIRLHSLLGNRWSLIAGRLPGRTDNEIKNYWNSHLSKRLREKGIEVREGTSKGTLKRARATQKKNENTDNKSSSHDRKNRPDKRKKKEAEGTGEMNSTKIYVPKPTRFTPSLRNYNAMENSSGSDIPQIENTISEEEKGDTIMEDLEVNWSDINDGGFFFEEYDPNHVIACDFPSTDGLLERLYQEYSELLNPEGDQVQLNDFPQTFLL